MNAAIARIILRYLAGILIARGLISEDFAQDPDVFMALEALVGFAIMAGTEVWYMLAKKLGWNT